MKDHAGWEQVHFEVTTEIGHAAMTHRMKVPGGWIYMHTTMLARAFRRDEVLRSLVFVPESAERPK
jgi:hypothetical protein